MISEPMPLQSLGLEKRWPKLAQLQAEVAELTRQLQKSGAEVQTLERELEGARSKDLDREAKAIRAGKKVPEPTEEPKVQRKLDAARRNRDVLQRALEAAQTDLSALRSKHQGALYEDIVQARQAFADEAAAGARKALANYGRWHELRYLLRDLTPPPAPEKPEEAQRVTNVFLSTTGVIGTNSTEPDRGEVEGWLNYVISLGVGEESGEDAA